MEKLKKRNLLGVGGGMTALVGMFLPYVEGASFFQSLSGPEYGFLAPWLTLLVALAMVLYALGFDWLPRGVSIAVFLLCALLPGYACWNLGVGVVLPQLRVGAWTSLAGLLVMTLCPLFQRDTT